ncbi:MAG TPA: carboxypeptidase-like regulatory domain-containing protein, partial [Bryobacteraceae bacterium]
MKIRRTLQRGLLLSISNGRLLSVGVSALTLFLALSSQSASAQVVSGSMVGNVTDASGGAIAGANVKITLTQTNDVRTVLTNEAGTYTIATVTPGTYTVEVTKSGFRSFVAPNVLVNQNNVVRVDAQLPVGAMTERVEVTAEAAALETDRADVHAEVTSAALTELPQANRTYEGLMELIPGAIPPGGQLSGGTNNPSKAMTFGFNGSGTTAPTVRIEGINAVNLWVRSYQSYVPSVEAIQNVNVATNATDAEQGIAGGASVNVALKSGSNATHGGVYEYNIDSVFEANNFFSPTSKPPHLVDNNFGGFMGGHIIRNKLFYFGSYEVDLNHSADSAILSIPNAVQLTGNMSGSGNPIYDPTTGTP